MSFVFMRIVKLGHLVVIRRPPPTAIFDRVQSLVIFVHIAQK
jgi:hypothetical protein